MLQQALMAAAVAAWAAGPALPPAHRIDGVPLAEQHRNWCGPVALAAVLQYHGDPVRAEEIAQEVYRSSHRGSLNLDLLVYARQRGFEVRAERGTPEQVKQAVARDRPVVCMIRSRSLLASSNHYVVVRGYDDDADVWLVDGGDGKERRVGRRGFAKDWEACRNWMMVVERRAEEPYAARRPAPEARDVAG